MTSRNSKLMEDKFITYYSKLDSYHEFVQLRGIRRFLFVLGTEITNITAD